MRSSRAARAGRACRASSRTPRSSLGCPGWHSGQPHPPERARRGLRAVRDQARRAAVTAPGYRRWCSSRVIAAARWLEPRGSPGGAGVWCCQLGRRARAWSWDGRLRGIVLSASWCHDAAACQMRWVCASANSGLRVFGTATGTARSTPPVPAPSALAVALTGRGTGAQAGLRAGHAEQRGARRRGPPGRRGVPRCGDLRWRDLWPRAGGWVVVGVGTARATGRRAGGQQQRLTAGLRAPPPGSSPGSASHALGADQVARADGGVVGQRDRGGVGQHGEAPGRGHWMVVDRCPARSLAHHALHRSVHDVTCAVTMRTAHCVVGLAGVRTAVRAGRSPFTFARTLIWPISHRR